MPTSTKDLAFLQRTPQGLVLQVVRPHSRSGFSNKNFDHRQKRPTAARSKPQAQAKKHPARSPAMSKSYWLSVCFGWMRRQGKVATSQPSPARKRHAWPNNQKVDDNYHGSIPNAYCYQCECEQDLKACCNRPGKGSPAPGANRTNGKTGNERSVSQKQPTGFAVIRT
jgi:hypothetical protein